MAGGHGQSTRSGPRPLAFVPFPAKLSPPMATIPVVARPRLVDELVGFGGRVAVLSAPAGYGKSILAAQWLAADPRQSTWLALDPTDNDPHVLLTYLAIVLGDDSGAHGLDADAELADLLIALQGLLAARADPFLLILDDAHVLDEPSATVVRTLAEHIPAGSTLAVLTRDPPVFPTARGVLHGDVLVCDRAALAMTTDEATALLRSGGLPDSPDTIEILTNVTEGWAAGLYLAALALRDADDPRAAAREISGRQRVITDFFAEEVLAALTPDDVDFLLATSVLDRCSAELCDTVLDRTDSGTILERLARTNRFVIPLDDRGEWYRYHHLFAEMLQAEARRRDPTALARVALGASEWWEARFEPEPAVALARAASDDARAIDLITRFSPIFQNDRRLVTVSRWLDGFSDEEVMATPALARTAAWNALLVGDIGSVHRYAAALERSGAEILPDGTPPAAAVDLLRALTTADGLHALETHARAAVEHHPQRNPYRGIATHLVSSARLLLGDLQGAMPFIDDAIALGRMQLHPVEAHALASRARLLAIEGDVRGALRSADDAVAVMETHWLTDRPPLGVVYSAAALVHALAGSTARAAEHRARALALIDRLDDVLPFHAAVALLECAESALRCDEIDEATDVLTEAERRMRRLRDTGLLSFALERVGAELSLRSARPVVALVEPLSPAELRVLGYLPTHLSFGEIGEELFVSRNTVKSHAMAIYRKLGVTSRSAAVKEAGELGLL